MNKYKFFWNGPFSNWYPSDFTYNGIFFNCGEQAMMYEKAITFTDYETAKEILQSNSPKEQKTLGRKVKNFNPEIWDTIKYEKVKEILRCKFEQNAHLLDLLVRNKGLEFVEASPYDRIWGIGYDESTALDNINDWGENLLGKILTELSNEKMEKIENIDILILRPSDIIERLQRDFDVSNLREFVKYFKFDDFDKVINASLILFIDSDGTTTILKNRYGKSQI